MNRDDFMRQWDNPRCPGCGAMATDVHHVFKRRIKRFEKELYDECNVAPACNSCNCNETQDFQLECALFIFRQLEAEGFDPPRRVREWDRGGPWRVKGLPKHFYEAERVWDG